MAYRLLALDVDGTLLDPAGVLRPAVRDAVVRAQQCGVQVVLCTGRRFRTARPVAQELGLTGPIVVHNGALIKDVASGHTLEHHYLSADVYRQAFGVLQQISAPMVYVDAYHENIDILTQPLEQSHPFQREYLHDQLEHCRFVDADTTLPQHGVVLMSIMADAAGLQPLQATAKAAVGAQGNVYYLINKNYSGHILEIIPAQASKWRALESLAAAHGIAAADMIAIGDDQNDVEMIRHAGLGIAMGNAVEAVKAVAAHVTGSNAEDGVVQAITRFLLRA